jgi:hypothetical protein
MIYYACPARRLAASTSGCCKCYNPSVFALLGVPPWYVSGRQTDIFKIYRKPTTTDSIIPSDSCHPQEHKHAAIRHMINRMNTYSLNKEDKEDEKNTIKHIISNNKYNTTIINKLGKHKNNKKKSTRNKMGQIHLHRKGN